MREKLKKLIDVKTIITFTLVFSSVYLAITGRIDPMEIVRLAGISVAFFFGTKLKNGGGGKDE